MTTLTGEASPDGWTTLAGGLHTRLRTGDFATGLRLVAAVGAAAEKADHHPDLDLRHTHLDVRLTSHDAHGVTERDVALAGEISAIAAAHGVQLGVRGVSRVEFALDSPAHASIMPFWQAVLGAERTGDAELTDPAGVLPAVWFQQSGDEEPRQRWHPDVWIAPAEVQPRIEAAVAAGGSLVSDAEAPSFWVLADAEGNRVCLCTWQDRVNPQ